MVLITKSNTRRKGKALCWITIISSRFFVGTSSFYFNSSIYQMSLFCSIWHDNNHWSSCGVRHDWNVRWSFWPGSWYLPFDHHPGIPIINISKYLTSIFLKVIKYFHSLVIYCKDNISFSWSLCYSWASLSCLMLC